MEFFRYALSVLMLVSFPGAYVFWFIIHPFIDFWRSRGLLAAYVTTFGSMAAIGFMAFWFRDFLMGRDLGTNWWFFSIGLGLYLLCWIMERMVRRHLKFKILVGVPELKNSSEQKLLTEGMFRLVRHPRYLTIIVGMIGWSLICNYTGIYLLVAISIPLFVAITMFEEKELLRRFGGQYEQYRRDVPRIFPTLGSFKSAFWQRAG